MVMVCTALIKDRGFAGFLLLCLVGLLLPAPGSSTTTNAAVTSVATASTTQTPSIQSQSTVATTGSMTMSATSQASTVTTQSTTSGAMTQSGTTMMTTGSNTSSSTSSTNSTTWMMTTNSTNGMPTTAMPNALYCPSFTCNYSDCYTMYNSQNATWCPADCFCQLSKQMDMSYIANCSTSCGSKCVNDSQMNCCVECCNTTGCLNSTFASMMMSTTTTVSTTVTTTTTATTTATTTTAPTTVTPQNNGMKCHTGTCEGESCYTNFKNNPLQICTDSEPHCQLKKNTGSNGLKWNAGCTSDCSEETTCANNMPPPCLLECCNATKTSCLLLTGELNVPSSATRGLYLHRELTGGLLCLLAVALML